MEDQSKKSKKFAVGELPLSPTTSTTKRPTRHHVKRRSSGRVHVTKLAPMARAHEDDDKKSMKRSHSSKSLHRLNSNERKLGISGFTPAAAAAPPVQPSQQQQQQQITKDPSPPATPTIETITTGDTIDNTINDTKDTNTTTKRQNTLLDINKTAPVLPPVEQTLSVTANELVSCDKPVFNGQRSIPSTNKKQVLKSQFVEPPPPPTPSFYHGNNNSNKIRVATSQPLTNNMTRTQQKLMLQREQTFITDENNMAHPKNMLRLTREMEKMGREYRCVKRYEDPMMASLIRCQQKRERPGLLNSRTVSSSVLPIKEFRPHYDQRRRILLNAAMYKNEKEQQQQQQQLLLLQKQQQHHQLQQQHYLHEYKEDMEKKPLTWSTFLDRLFYG